MKTIKEPTKELLIECIDNLNNPNGSEIKEIVNYLIKPYRVILPCHVVQEWMDQLVKDKVCFQVPVTSPKRYKLCIGY